VTSDKASDKEKMRRMMEGYEKENKDFAHARALLGYPKRKDR